MAIDRGHPVLSAEADGLHPSVLLLIDQTVRAAHQHGKWVGICGELAGDPKAVPVLMGLGVDELSMSSTRIPLVKAQIRQLNFADCQQLAQRDVCGGARCCESSLTQSKHLRMWAACLTVITFTNDLIVFNNDTTYIRIRRCGVTTERSQG